MDALLVTPHAGVCEVRPPLGDGSWRTVFEMVYAFLLDEKREWLSNNCHVAATIVWEYGEGMGLFTEKILLHKSVGLPGWPNDRHELAIFISTEITKSLSILDLDNAPVSITIGMNAYQSSVIARNADDDVVRFVNGITIATIAMGIINDNKAKIKRNPNIVGIYLDQAMEIFVKLTAHCTQVYKITDGIGSIIPGICAEYSGLKHFIAQWRSTEHSDDILAAYRRYKYGSPASINLTSQHSDSYVHDAPTPPAQPTTPQPVPTRSETTYSAHPIFAGISAVDGIVTVFRSILTSLRAAT